MHDLILKGGRIIDPASGLDETGDIAFSGGKVSAVGPDLPADGAKSLRDVSGQIVVPGLIDLHTHVYWGALAIGIDPVDYARRSGVTTIVDAGSAGAGGFAGFRAHVIEPAAPRILAYLNISFPGIFAFSREVMVGECADYRLLNADTCLEVARENPDLIVGIKVRVGEYASNAMGVAPLDIALEVAEEAGLPVMCHLDRPPPSRLEVVSRLRPGDILTHCFRPFPNAPARGDGAVHAEILAARERGIVFDIGHGMGSFGFATAEAMLAAGFLPDVISSDVHCLSIEGPAFDQLVTLSKFLCLGMTLPQVIAASTTGPAKALRRPDLGRLTVGGIGDATVLTLEEGDFPLTDTKGITRQSPQRLSLAGIVLQGEWWYGD